MKKLKFIDLYAGLGGFHQSLAKLGHHCEWASEYNENLRILYKKNFPNTPIKGDIFKVDLSKIPEVGHHINGHTKDALLIINNVLDIESLSESRKMELEADEFAGFVLAKLGATLADATESVELISTNEDDTYSTHPSKSKRIDAIRKGHNKAKVNVISYEKTSSSIAEEFFYSAYEKDENGDYYGAIADYTKAIELDPDDADAYNNRGLVKDNLEDHYGAIADYTKAIELDPDDADAYYNRGLAKSKLEDHYGAIADYTKAIELDPNYAAAYNNRGLVKDDLEDYYGAIADYTKAIELDPNKTFAYYNRGLAKNDLEDYYGAIADYTKAIKLDPNKADAYNNRSVSKELLGDLKGACNDAKKAVNLGNTLSAKWVANNCN